MVGECYAYAFNYITAHFPHFTDEEIRHRLLKLLVSGGKALTGRVRIWRQAVWVSRSGPYGTPYACTSVYTLSGRSCFPPAYLHIFCRLQGLNQAYIPIQMLGLTVTVCSL